MMWFTLLLIVCLHEQAFAFQPSPASISLRVTPFKPWTHFDNVHKTCHCRAHTDDNLEREAGDQSNVAGESTNSVLQGAFEGFPLGLLRKDGFKKLPPLRFEDLDLLFYDIFLIVNLSLSISFWVTHRVDFSYLPSALNDGCIFSLFWILSGLYHGAFLMSAVDGHYGSSDAAGGPKAAAALGLNTYIGAVNMRLVFLLASSALQNREIGAIEELVFEIGCGLLLMTMWRALHSYVAPRI
mmetsp:Transcript_31969/g.77622  ORF Transcript_31969/g.77622 Transcript_31969/m.77622 type:complete len:240 (+) Transcript_31969:34-753(+)